MAASRRCADAVALSPLAGSHGDDAIELLAEALRDDPNLRWCFLGDQPGYEDRLHGYLRAGHAWHTATGQPVQAAFDGDALVGVAYVSDADAAPGVGELSLLGERLERACGEEAAARFAHYGRAVEAVSPEEPHHVLALIAVRRDWRGLGVGSRLVRWLCARCDADPVSRGVLLDTATERNVAFYRRHGFEVVAEVPLEAPPGGRAGPHEGVVERVMVRPRG